MKTHLLVALLLLPLAARGATPTNDIAINANLLPNTQYQVSADVSTSAVSSLLALLGGGETPIQILDSAGNLLGEISAPDLSDLLQGLTGSATVPVSTLIQTGADAVDGLVLRVLDTPTLATSNVVVSAVGGPVNTAPTVRITQRRKSGDFLRLRGTATDDVKVTRVEVRANGRIRSAHGTERWNVRLPLRDGTNRIMVRAFDSSNTVSAPARTRVVKP